MLVFLSGEREIHDTADALRRLDLHTPRCCRCTPGCRRPSSTASSSRTPGRRIVLATNVAETSLTVPGVRYVVDAGSARISRYSHRLKVQRLPIEPVSQASANQRAGRCGRVAAGICIRLYDEDDFVGRPEFTEPEILRTNLASVILQMTALGLGDVGCVPVPRPARHRAIRDGYALLDELGALRVDDADDRRSGGGRRLTRSARSWRDCRSTPGSAAWCSRPSGASCVREVLVDRRRRCRSRTRANDRPSTAQAADELHRRFAVDGSDFLAFVRLWDHLPRAPAGAGLEPVPQAVPGRVPELPARPRVAGPVQPAAPGRRARSASGMARARHPEPAGTRRRSRATGSRAIGADGRPAVAPRHPRRRRRASIAARTVRSSRSPASLGAAKQLAALGHGRRAGRDEPAVGAHGRRRSSPSGPSGSAAHLVKSLVRRRRAGTPSAARRSPSSGSRCTGCRSSADARSASTVSTPRSPADCSSATRWSRATGPRTTRSWPTTGP